MYTKDLGNGLVLRWAKEEDVEKVANGMIDVFSPPDERLEWMKPFFLRYAAGACGFLKHPKDIVVIVDTKKDGEPLVGFTSYWQETHTYEGIPYAVARPEFVGIMPNPEYRGKRFQQHIMDALHARAEDEGALVQVINGINWYYRQFGYEYAIEFGKRSKVWLSTIPRLKEDQQEAVTHRCATLDDIETIQEIDLAQQHDSAIFLPLTREWIASQFPNPESMANDMEKYSNRHTLIFEDGGGNAVGYAVLTKFDIDPHNTGNIGVYSMGIAPGAATTEVLLSAMRNILAYVKNNVDEKRFSEFTSLAWHMSQWHPVVEAIPAPMRAFAKIHFEDPCYYVRVPDLVKFVQHILPSLNRRLEQSYTHKTYSGTVKVSNYTPRYPGFELKIDKGVIISVSQFVKRTQEKEADVAYFPPYSFLQVLFGRKSIAELMDFLPDVVMEEEIEKVLNVIFPLRTSIVPHLM